MKPLLVLLERLWGPLGASSTALGVSWGALVQGHWELVGSSWGRPRLRKPFTFQKQSFRLGRSTILEIRQPPAEDEPVRARNGKRVQLETMRI